MAKKPTVQVKRTPIPFTNNIIVSRKTPETVSKGGLIIPESAIEDENEGIVVAVGPLVGKSSSFIIPLGSDHLIPAIGDRVLFGSNAGTTVKCDGEEFFLMRESDILCKL